MLFDSTKTVYVALGKMAQGMECLFYMYEDLRLDSQYPHKSQAWQHICILVLGGQKQVDPWSVA